MAASDYTPTTLNYRLHLTGCPQMDSGHSLLPEGDCKIVLIVEELHLATPVG